MSPLKQTLITFFEHTAQKQDLLLEQIKLHHSFRVEQDRWCFTLPQLHHFLQSQDEVFRTLDYKQFRQVLFKSPINQTIKQYGAEIQIVQNHAKVDRTLYAMLWSG